MPILLDTNVYLFAIKSDQGSVFFERRFLPLVFQTYLSSVVVEELYAGALDAGAVRLVERYVGGSGESGPPGYSNISGLEGSRQSDRSDYS